MQLFYKWKRLKSVPFLNILYLRAEHSAMKEDKDLLYSVFEMKTLTARINPFQATINDYFFNVN